MIDLTFKGLSRALVAEILDDNTYKPSDKPSWLLPIEMRFQSFNEIGESPNVTLLNARETKARLEQWCRDAFVYLAPGNVDLASHVQKLDELLSPLMKCSFLIHKQKWNRGEIIDRACTLMARLPSYPPELSFEFDGKRGQPAAKDPWPEEYFSSSSFSSTGEKATTATLNQYE